MARGEFLGGLKMVQKDIVVLSQNEYLLTVIV
ncbi:hypothetical protein DESHY_20123 [Desulforamulus hydrothermalis Lam5 = DSM 18033]|uniref:Uncharacterized protein n=1 Tax=Desulforamulus hydrothermalis Lam5 = DSM 18033 TaxID=1121428 RepID=K8DZ46_9FIRM|nr:hypothetical protein DESHY_20123 [Desulforamulus hydrothermalis Lam5 = DSM 18033]